LPDGRLLTRAVLGLSYFSAASGQSVLIAEVKDCQGELHPPNVIVYPDAFTDIKADVRISYTKAGMEQDVIVHSIVDLWVLDADCRAQLRESARREGTCSEACKWSEEQGDGPQGIQTPAKIRKLQLALYRQARATA
jgi:hypothetical protein